MQYRSNKRKKIYNKNEFRRKHQKLKQTHDYTELEGQKREHIYKRKQRIKSEYMSKAAVSSPVQNIPKQSVEIELSTFLLLIKNLVKSNQVSLEDLNKILDAVKEEKDSLIVEDPNHPNRVFHVTKKTSKGQLRDHWMYLMHNNQLFCDICGKPIDTLQGPMRLTYDHIQPRSKGGKTDGQNGSPTHSICNNAKGNILPEVWEKVGLEILNSRGIGVDLNRAMYNYKQNQR